MLFDDYSRHIICKIFANDPLLMYSFIGFFVGLMLSFVSRLFESSTKVLLVFATFAIWICSSLGLAIASFPTFWRVITSIQGDFIYTFYSLQNQISPFIAIIPNYIYIMIGIAVALIIIRHVYYYRRVFHAFYLPKKITNDCGAVITIKHVNHDGTAIADYKGKEWCVVSFNHGLIRGAKYKISLISKSFLYV